MVGLSEKIYPNPDDWVLCLILYVYKYSFINIPNEYVVLNINCSYTYTASLCQSILNVNDFNILNGKCFWKDMSKSRLLGLMSNFVYIKV